MAKDETAEVFMPPNMLKAKVGGTVGGLDIAAIKRAEAAMETLKSEFSDWIAQDVVRLYAALETYVANRDEANGSDLFRAAHDLKGQATTFEYPLIARVASSLCKLIDAQLSHEKLPLPLVEAHIDAIRVIHRDKIKDMSNLTALVIVEELERRVSKSTAHLAPKR